jgi:hypothetical protein
MIFSLFFIPGLTITDLLIIANIICNVIPGLTRNLRNVSRYLLFFWAFPLPAPASLCKGRAFRCNPVALQASSTGVSAAIPNARPKNNSAPY